MIGPWRVVLGPHDDLARHVGHLVMLDVAP
jgi:hypothetical protein